MREGKGDRLPDKGCTARAREREGLSVWRQWSSFCFFGGSGSTFKHKPTHPQHPDPKPYTLNPNPYITNPKPLNVIPEASVPPPIS